MDPGWAEALRPVEPQIRHMGRLLRERIGHGEHIAPASRNILRAFTIPFDSIHVLIVGQDPYPTSGYAVGLSFSVAPNVHPLPKSLVNIFKELEDDLHVPPPCNGDLTPWTHRGWNCSTAASPSRLAGRTATRALGLGTCDRLRCACTQQPCR